jgi:hypothetical protein
MGAEQPRRAQKTATQMEKKARREAKHICPSVEQKQPRKSQSLQSSQRKAISRKNPGKIRNEARYSERNPRPGKLRQLWHSP